VDYLPLVARTTKRQQVGPLVLNEVEKQHGVAAGALLDVVSFGPLWPLGNDLYPGIFFRHELALLFLDDASLLWLQREERFELVGQNVELRYQPREVLAGIFDEFGFLGSRGQATTEGRGPS
jgi:hypothetical protein